MKKEIIVATALILILFILPLTVGVIYGFEFALMVLLGVLLSILAISVFMALYYLILSIIY